MADIIRALTEMADRLGVGILVVMAMLVLCAAVGYGSYYIVKWNRQLVDKLVEVSGKIVEVTASNILLSNTTIARNTVAMNDNTESNLKVAVAMQENTRSVDKLVDAFGSDPLNNICRIQKVRADAKEQGVDLSKVSDEQILMVAETIAKKKAEERK